MTGDIDDELGIPDEIAGPFLSERRVTGRFRHEGVQTASVVFYVGGGCTVITTEGAREIEPHRRWAKISTLCEIVRGRHVTAFEVMLPAAGAATFFKTTVSLRWEVTDFRLVAEKRLRSVEEDLRPEIVTLLRQVSERYSVDQAQWANQAIRTQIENGEWSRLGRDVGLAVQMFVEVGTDRAHIKAVQSRREEESQLAKIRGRMPLFDGVAGDAQKQIALWLSSTDPHQIHEALKVLREEAAEGRRENQTMALRMMQDGRIASPELEAYLRAQVMPEARSWAPPPRSPEWAAAPAAPAAPPRPELPPAQRGPWPADQDDRPDRDSDTDRTTAAYGQHASYDDDSAPYERNTAYEDPETRTGHAPRVSRSDDEHWAATAEAWSDEDDEESA
ncbi:hypothetical protein [Streptomyces sp. NPDC019890]|uniref:hypothetical protein n=1 Tax=Streptomyces sp. NPDC019890 TaxID=3365064 RepID=UPI00384CCE4C